jgi:hypothetical protein
MAAFALWRLLPAMGPCGRDYLLVLVGWGGLNFAYLAWYFSFRRDWQLASRAMESGRNQP